jgi:hypothetical protein
MWYSGNLIALVIYFVLPQFQLIGTGPSAHQVNHTLLPLSIGTAHRLPINADHFPFCVMGHLLSPLKETLFELLRVKGGKEPVKGIVQRDAFW